jgi:hypothetical protein
MAFDQPSPSAPAANTGNNGRFAAVRRSFIAYAHWLDSISWKRFFLLSILALIVSAMLSDLPPFSLKWGEDRTVAVTPQGRSKLAPVIQNELKRYGHSFDIRVDDGGVHITPHGAASAASAADSAPGVSISPDSGVTVRLPKDADTEEIKRAIEEAQSEIEDAVAETKPKVRTIHAYRLGDDLPGFVMLLIVMSAVIKLMAAGRFKAEAQAAQATKNAESEALKRQVVEARMAAMQAQVEPHFLFNTLASIDHLIETDPPRASKMQKNLIALLRAAMPTMREANAQGTRDLGRELAVIRPYLEILKVRMEDRLHTDVRVSDGLLSAEFPPMMLQSLVENAIKHGLEPKAEGGTLTVSAEIVHGKLAVTVADDGLGFGRAATAGTGIGLNNIRERLQLLYGSKASLNVTENPGGGTAVVITVPYTARHQEGDAA